MSYYQKHIFVCLNQKENGKVCCAQAGTPELKAYLKQRLIELGLHGKNKVRVSHSGCMGRCAMGPTFVVYPDQIWYRCLTKNDIDDVIEQHIIGGNPVSRLMMEEQ